MSVCYMLNERANNENTGTSGMHRIPLNINIQSTEDNNQTISNAS